MPNEKIQFSKRAPIVPGDSLAGIPLGASIADVSHLVKQLCLTIDSVTLLSPFQIRYCLGKSVWLNFSLHLNQIESMGVQEGYSGLIAGKIGIGYSIGQAEKDVGNLTWDRKTQSYWADTLSGLELCIDSDTDALADHPDRPITQILIHFP